MFLPTHFSSTFVCSMTYHRMRQYGCCLHEQTSLWLLPPWSAWPVRHGDTTEADWVSRMHTAWWTKANTVLQLIYCGCSHDWWICRTMQGLWIYSLSQVLSFGTIKHSKLKTNTRKERVYTRWVGRMQTVIHVPWLLRGKGEIESWHAWFMHKALPHHDCGWWNHFNETAVFIMSSLDCTAHTCTCMYICKEIHIQQIIKRFCDFGWGKNTILCIQNLIFA